MNENTSTTQTETAYPAIELHAPVARPVMVGELARAEAREQAALAEVERLRAEIQALRTEQITDGGDSRLTEFWDKAGRIADHANFCEEYDRLAEAMNGVQRERDWDVTIRVEFTMTINRTVTAVSSDDAIESVEDFIGKDDIADLIRSEGWDDYTIVDSDASRA